MKKKLERRRSQEAIPPLPLSIRLSSHILKAREAGDAQAGAERRPGLAEAPGGSLTVQTANHKRVGRAGGLVKAAR